MYKNLFSLPEFCLNLVQPAAFLFSVPEINQKFKFSSRNKLKNQFLKSETHYKKIASSLNQFLEPETDFILKRLVTLLNPLAEIKNLLAENSPYNSIYMQQFGAALRNLHRTNTVTIKFEQSLGANAPRIKFLQVALISIQLEPLVAFFPEESKQQKLILFICLLTVKFGITDISWYTIRLYSPETAYILESRYMNGLNSRRKNIVLPL